MTPQPSEQPRTAAGRALARITDVHQTAIVTTLRSFGQQAERIDYRPTILAIEAEAAAPATYTEVERLDTPGNRADLKPAAPDPAMGRRIREANGIRAQLPDPVASPLDVERLARALTQAHLYPQPPRNKPFGADTPYDMAASIAAAYALEGQPVAEEPNPNAVPDFGPQWTNKGASFGTHEDKPEQPRSQRAAMADAQWKAMPDLAKVLRAWDRGPEFIESLLSWGFRITREAAAPDPVASPAPLDVERLARALKVELNRTHRAGEYEELAEAVAAAYAAEGQPVAEEPRP